MTLWQRCCNLRKEYYVLINLVNCFQHYTYLTQHHSSGRAQKQLYIITFHVGREVRNDLKLWKISVVFSCEIFILEPTVVYLLCS